MSLKIGPGIDSIPTDTIPNDPADFIAWFKGVGMKRWFANADVRNAIAGAGISITSTFATPATISGELLPIPNDTVLGNVSGAAAEPSALTQTQLTSLINPATTSLSGALTVLSGSANQFLDGLGSFTSIPNSALVNDSVTIGSTNVLLGATVTAFAGLTTLSLSGQLSSTLATGTAPFVVASTTQVANLSVATAANLAGGAAGSIPYQTGAGATALLATAAGVLVGGTTPAYSTAPTLTGTNFTGIPIGALPTSPTFQQITSSGSSGTYGIGVGGVLNGAATVNAFLSGVTYNSTVTAAIGYVSAPTISATTALGSMRHFQASGATITAGGTITTQVGYDCEALSGASTNIAFQGKVASAGSAWNLFMSGTAANFIAGHLLVGSSTDSGGGEILQVTGTASVSGSVGVNGAAPPTQPTGYGTPTNGALISSINGTTTYTVVQLAAYIAQLALDMKKYGLVAA